MDEMTPAHVRRAVEIYLRHAYPAGSGKTPRITVAHLGGAPTLERMFELFERPSRGQEPAQVRYSLRLGNHVYQHMKFVVQEYLVDEEFFFSVDSHDNLDVRPEQRDYEGFQELKRFNRTLKEEIERAWAAAGLPTNVELRELCEGLGGLEREGSKRKRLLVVDDEKDVALGVSALLKGRGYDVEVAHSGEQVLERLRREPLPDLVLLDFELPHIDGRLLLELLRADPRLDRVPILMATAAEIELSSLRRVSGLLRKPYPREVLFAMLRRLLEPASG